ncbi:MAG: sugar phosphate isomerase/epimerase [Oscillospiraceae bacterium]|nr:sugar phosphate isomerase/epimerase [Oscillospiraceae bacterium]
MKIGVTSYSFSQMIRKTGTNYFRICDAAKEMGYEFMDFTDIDPALAGADNDIKAAKVINDYCGKIGLEIGCYTVGADFINGSNGNVKAEIENIKHKVDVAAALGAKIMRHDATGGFKSQEQGRNYRDAIKLIAEPIREVTRYAAFLGIKTCTENHGYFMQDSNRVEELILAVDDPNYGWLVDMGNFMCADEDSVHAVSTAAPYAFYVHVKDFLWKSGKELTPGDVWFQTRGGNYLRGTVVGHGVVPVAQCINILKNAGYDGNLTVEFEGMEENTDALKAAYNYMKRITE